jgi:UPF0176 protein
LAKQLILIEENELKIGDEILIVGTTTGEQKLQLDAIFVNNEEVEKAIAGSVLTLKLPFRTRLSDKIYKIESIAITNSL